MSAVDTAWLRMDRPGNLMVICGVLLFDERIDLARLRSIVERRFLRFERFLMKPVQDATASRWEGDEGFDLGRHVVGIRLPGGDPTHALQVLASRLASQPLDDHHPMWRFHLIENYGEGSAVVIRIHHCYADGIALIQVMLSLMDAGRNGPPAMPLPKTARGRSAPADDEPDPLAQRIEPVANALETARSIGATIVEKGVEIWQNPLKALELAQQGTALTAELAKLALMSEDSRTRFKGTPGERKKVAWAPPLALGEVKAIGKALGASVNDVLLASVAGALREYLVRKGDEVDGVTIRALVPVNLRPLDRAYELGNQFGLVFLELPVGIANPVERLYAVRANMRALKGSYQPILALGLLAAMGAGPKLLQDQLLVALARKATAVMTNVPGPLPRRRADAQPDVLGSAIGGHRHGRLRALLRRRRAVRADHRRRPRARPSADHRPIRLRIREARADGAAVAAVGRRPRSACGGRGREPFMTSIGPTRRFYRFVPSPSDVLFASSTSRRSIASAGLHFAASS
jgi:WS/DGAT/MGAT family acyltransferase